MHAIWLSDAGLFIEVKPSMFRITNQGQDYLEVIRDEGAWQKIKDEVARFV